MRLCDKLLEWTGVVLFGTFTLAAGSFLIALAVGAWKLVLG